MARWSRCTETCLQNGLAVERSEPPDSWTGNARYDKLKHTLHDVAHNPLIARGHARGAQQAGVAPH